MSDVRTDINRALREADKPNPIIETVKGVAAIGGGLAVGTLAGRAIMKRLQRGNLTKNALDHVRMNDAVHNVVKGQSNYDRFRSAQKARRK